MPDNSKAGKQWEDMPSGSSSSTTTIAVRGGKKTYAGQWMAPLMLLLMAFHLPPAPPPTFNDHHHKGLFSPQCDELFPLLGKSPLLLPNHIQVNMLMTERRRGRSPSPLPSTSADTTTDGIAPHQSDPSLMDYEAIDVYWRRDIELEKNGPHLLLWANIINNNGGVEEAVGGGNDDQFERDLQVLTEKSMMPSPFRLDQEDLSKSHFSDFYRAATSPATATAIDDDLDFTSDSLKDPFPISLLPDQHTDIELTYPSTSTASCGGDPFAVAVAHSPPLSPLNLMFPFDDNYGDGNDNEEESQVVVVGNDNEEVSTATAVEDALDCFAFNQFFDLPASFDERDLLPQSRHASPSSSGIGSSMSSFSTSPSASCSPRSYHCDSSSRSVSSASSRFVDKLFPRLNEPPRKRGRQSKDCQLGQENGLPATAEQLTAMSHKQIQHLLRDPTMSQQQRALIKKIRRRGRNKEAARKCRERRTSRLPPVEESIEEQKPSTSKKNKLHN